MPRLAPTAELGLAAGSPLPFTLTTISQRASPFDDATPKQNPHASDRILPGVSRDDNSILGTLQRGIPGATAAFSGQASVSDRAVGGVLVDAWSKVKPSGLAGAGSTGVGGSFLTSTPLAFFASV